MISVNLGLRSEILLGSNPVETGIAKLATTEAVVATSVGLEGDFKARGDAAGFQALSAYPVENYEFWGEHFRRPLDPGAFGENLSLRGATEEQVHLGGLLVGDEVVLEITYPRTPCKKLNVHLGERFSGSFLQSGRVGYYLRVLKPGRIGPGDVLEYRPSSCPTVKAFVLDGLAEYWDPNRLRELAHLPSLSEDWRQRMSAKIPRAESAPGWIGPRSLQVVSLERNDAGTKVEVRCLRGRLLPEMARGDTLGFDHRANYLDAARSVVSRPLVEGVDPETLDRKRVVSYSLTFDAFPLEIEQGATIRARAPSSLLRY